jgi:4a-hydroxytetrahydrobiopterin dehydratase
MNKEGAASGWSYDAERPALCRTFAFGSFSEAFAFMARAALAAEKTDHHPDWQNSYNTVSVRLSTHSAGGVTEKDLAMAEAMDAIVGD